ncbi:Uncharacterized protein dnm_013800 [Desulfonema magnum]|uniref:Uncharacterized protein n=1 Tax=Desulfonema magnum TaxID=45655 RepID=A0A975BH22_9BACT|nr:Uncharacterized protein dnm_013800 [Desulfonema magnum]
MGCGVFKCFLCVADRRHSESRILKYLKWRNYAALVEKRPVH